MGDPEQEHGALTEQPEQPAEELEEITERRIQRVIATHLAHYSGPMPPPSFLAEYEKLVPGAAKAIVDEFVANGAHVRKMDTKAIDYAKDEADKNRRVAAGIVILALAVVFVLALFGQKEVAIAVAVTTVGAVITGFLNRKPDAKEKAKDEQDSP